jgi:hypothetical protein
MNEKEIEEEYIIWECLKTYLRKIRNDGCRL